VESPQSTGFAASPSVSEAVLNGATPKELRIKDHSDQLRQRIRIPPIDRSGSRTSGSRFQVARLFPAAALWGYPERVKLRRSFR